MASWCLGLCTPLPLYFLSSLSLLVEPKYTWMNAVNVSGKALSQAWSQAHPAKHNREQVEELKIPGHTCSLTSWAQQAQFDSRDWWKVLNVNMRRTEFTPCACVCVCVKCVQTVYYVEKSVLSLEQPQPQPRNNRLYVICNWNPSLMPAVLHPKCEISFNKVWAFVLMHIPQSPMIDDEMMKSSYLVKFYMLLWDRVFLGGLCCFHFCFYLWVYSFGHCT